MRSAPRVYRPGRQGAEYAEPVVAARRGRAREAALPGRWLALDLRLTVRGMGAGHVDCTRGLERAFAARHGSIGAALSLTRDLMGAEPEEVVENRRDRRRA